MLGKRTRIAVLNAVGGEGCRERAPVGKRIQSRLVLMNSGRLRVAANTLLFSDSILAFATDQLSKYTAVTTSARRTARRAARNQVGVQLGGFPRRAARNSPRFSLGGSDRAPPSPRRIQRPPAAGGGRVQKLFCK